MIYHVITKKAWQEALEKGFYVAPSLATEGFIHCSNKEQVAGVLERYYKNIPDLLLMHIDENRLEAEVKYEIAPSVNEAFPHVHGRLNLDAVVTTTEI